MPKAKKPKDPLAPPSRAVCGSIIKRFLKEDQPIVWGRDLSAFYRVWKQYPSVPFWEAYELPFGNMSLNMMTWFEGVEGQEELTRSWLLYHYTPPPIEEPTLDNLSTVDITPELSYDRPPTISTPRRARTVAELLASPMRSDGRSPHSFIISG